MLFLYNQFFKPSTLKLFDKFTEDVFDGHYQTTDANGKYHSYDDLPAVVYTNGTKMWYQHGERHRDHDQPSIVYPDGSKLWYQHGVIHRDNDFPAVVYPNGQEWWVNGSRIK